MKIPAKCHSEQHNRIGEKSQHGAAGIMASAILA